MTYAKDTSVPVERSRMEIESILARYGASCFGYMTQPERAQIAFEVHDRRVRFDIPMPSPASFATYKRKGSPYLIKRTELQVNEAWRQACRQRWRALALVVKAKLEAVECGVTSFEEEFLAHIILPGGRTVGETAIPAIAESYATGRAMPMLSLGSGEGSDGR